jgi:CspA family cold shock protein
VTTENDARDDLGGFLLGRDGLPSTAASDPSVDLPDSALLGWSGPKAASNLSWAWGRDQVYDPVLVTVVVATRSVEHDLASDALVGSVFRMLRQGQRVIFDLNEQGLATRLRLGSEVDMGTPGFAPAAES